MTENQPTSFVPAQDEHDTDASGAYRIRHTWIIEGGEIAITEPAAFPVQPRMGDMMDIAKMAGAHLAETIAEETAISLICADGSIFTTMPERVIGIGTQLVDLDGNVLDPYPGLLERDGDVFDPPRIVIPAGEDADEDEPGGEE